MDSALQLSRRNINSNFVIDEDELVQFLLDNPAYDQSSGTQIRQQCQKLIGRLRQNPHQHNLVDCFMREYDLSSNEGIVLMCLAEAMLRIPDNLTLDHFIQDKLIHGDWNKHLGHSESTFVNASTWGLLLSGSLVRPQMNQHKAGKVFQQLVKKVGEPLVRNGLHQAMKILGHQFVMGETIEQAIKRGLQQQPYRLSFDMLGEAALTAEDAAFYLQRYHVALDALAQHNQQNLFDNPGMSIKLSALHPRYHESQRQRVMKELLPVLIELIVKACQYNISITIDAEESDRLELSLDIIEQLLKHPELANWPGLGLALQAYQKRAVKVLPWLKNLALSLQHPIPVRLVKGAYWDSEIKLAQERGLDDYPVYTRKENTDTAYLYCARFLLDHPQCFYPQFATHNAHTAAAILHMAGENQDMEFQRLHGMGHALHDELLAYKPSRIYAPVGTHQQLLPYLVRRLLENGANTSFVNKLDKAEVDAELLSEDPLEKISGFNGLRNPDINYPRQLFGDERQSAPGLLLADRQCLEDYYQQMNRFQFCQWEAGSIINGKTLRNSGDTLSIVSPADPKDQLGTVSNSDDTHIQQALQSLQTGFATWSHRPVQQRADIIVRLADLLLQNQHELMALIIRETGRCLADAHNEIREAVDFCRYYAAQANNLQGATHPLPGPTGESNSLAYEARGIFVCISPWNFPVAIFCGQIVAALVTGNTVLAKASSKAFLCAHKLVQLMIEAGLPADCIALICTSGAQLQQYVLSDQNIAGVCFTGSSDTAKHINQTLAARPGALATLIAETGGQNVMFSDSSALPEQLAQDALESAFNSAGQRCSALRVLFLQEDTADRVITLLRGALAEKVLGHPWALNSDIGPVIDAQAKMQIQQHLDYLETHGTLLGKLETDTEGCYLAPHIYAIPSLDVLQQEIFGPVLHVIRYQARDLDKQLAAVNKLGYGLTLGIHSRVDSFIDRIRQQARVGNIYVNRNMIGAVVGVQPFGGRGLSGTGPKAGGPDYLRRFTTEKTVSINTAAVGGNAELLSKGASQPE